MTKTTFTKIIEVIVAPDGSTKLETKGFAGGGCREASAYLEQALGRRNRETLTSEFHLRAAEPHSVRQES
jgi:hypothetical protein